MDYPVVNAALLARYDRPGPRYTSYPTVPQWRDGFGEKDYRTRIAAAGAAAETPWSLYFHLPFCPRRCAYCGCNVIAAPDDAAVDRYLAQLTREIHLVAGMLGERRYVAQCHWGGGTPTYLDVPRLERLFSAISEAFHWCDDAEIAIETNPVSVTPEQLTCLRQLGFNRISLGVQDLDPAVQQAVGRGQSVAQTHTVVEHCRALGFKGVNFDLIYGLPLQKTATWRRAINDVLALRPDRLALYSYAHLPQRFAHQRILDALPMPDAAQKYGLFADAREMLLQAGYRAIGMDHFALPDDELALALDKRTLHRNFMGYTVRQAPDQLGFGVSAISEVGDCYAQNYKELEDYDRALDAGRLPTEKGLALDKDDLIRRWIIRRLMCAFEVDPQSIEERFAIQFDHYFTRETDLLKAFQQEGFVEAEGRRWRVTPLGAVFIRNICMAFDAYLDPQQSTLYSRTI